MALSDLGDRAAYPVRDGYAKPLRVGRRTPRAAPGPNGRLELIFEQLQLHTRRSCLAGVVS